VKDLKTAKATQIAKSTKGKTNGGHWCGAPLEQDEFVTFCAVLPPRSSGLK